MGIAEAVDPLRWRSAYLGVQRASDREILAELRLASVTINRQIKELTRTSKGRVGESVRIYQLQAVKRDMLAEQARIFRALGDTVNGRRAEAAARATDLGSKLDELIFAQAGRVSDVARLDQLKAGLKRGLASTIDTLVNRMSESRITLAQRIYRTESWMSGRVNSGVNSAIARGLTAREFAAEAVDWFRPDTPGGVRYAALRLSRSEINNAFHATAVGQALNKPWIECMRWHLSGSHPKSDACDQLATDDSFMLGPGRMPAGRVPRKPHPHCLCCVTPEPMDEQEFLDKLASGDFDDHLGVSGIPTPPEPRPKPKPVPAPKPKPVKKMMLVPGSVQHDLLKYIDADRKPIFRPGSKATEEALKRRGLLDDRGEITEAGREALRAADDKVKKDFIARQPPPPPKLTPKPNEPRRLSSDPRVRQAQEHGSKIVKVPDFPSSVNTSRPQPKGVIARELDRQAEFSPRAVLRLDSVDGGISGSKYAKDFVDTVGNSAGAYYTFGPSVFGDLHAIRIGPGAFSRPGSFHRAFSHDPVPEGNPWHVPSDRPGLESVIAHEFGHHIDRMLSNGTGNWAGDKARRLIETISDQLGLPYIGEGGPRLSIVRGETGYSFTDLDDWIVDNKSQVAKMVSEYGSANMREILAEIWCEYTTTQNPRPHIKVIGKLLRDMIEEDS